MIRPARHDFSLDLVRALRVTTLAALVMALALGCGSESEDPVATGPQGCPTGSVPWTDGSCMPVGIQGCADIFIEEDGLCHPRMAKCPAGTIPKFDEGCVPVGIQGCAEMLMEEDGLCHPSITKCPAGTIPKFDEGCVPVGIQGCAEVFMEDDGLCHPTMEKCPAGTFAVPQLGCMPIDGPDGCGTGTWGNLQEVAGVTTIWVDPSVGASGNGTMASPVKTIAEAMAMVPVGGRVALGAGTYDEPIHIQKTVTIEGRCPSMVRVQGTGSTGFDAYVVWVETADDVTLRNVTAGGAGTGILIFDASGLRIEWTNVRGATIAGIAIYGLSTEVSIANSLIDGTITGADGVSGLGIIVGHGASATLRESAVISNHEIGVFGSGSATEVLVTDSLIEGTLPLASSGKRGRGVEAESGAKLTLADSALVKNHEEGAIALHDTTSLVLTNSLVEGTLPSAATWKLGAGVVGAASAELTLLGAAILGNRYVGVVAQDTGTEVTVSGSLVQGTLPEQSDLKGGVGVGAARGARLVLGESTIAANSTHGVEARGTGTEVTMAGVLIEGQGDRGIHVQFGAALTLDRSAVVDNRDLGVAAFDADTNVTATGSLVAGTLSMPGDGDSGWGVAVSQGAHATLGANAIVANRGLGLYVGADGTEAMATGNLIAGTLPDDSDALSGVGVLVDNWATLTLDSNAIFKNQSTGLGAFGSGAILTGMRDLLEGTMPRQSDELFGGGVTAEGGAQVTLEAYAIIANHDAGLFAIDDTVVLATGSIVEGTLPRGANGEFGIGIVSDNLATVHLESSIVQGNRVSALQVTAATATVSRSLIDVVAAGSFTLINPTVTFDTVGDGLMAIGAATLDITDTRIQGCVRAGVLFDDSAGTLSGVVSTDNQFGLVLQGERRPSYESGNNQFSGNTGQDIVLGGDLAVPDAPSPIPPTPPPPAP